VVVITMIIIPIIGVQPLPARGADDHHRPGLVGTKMQVTLAKIELAMDAWSLLIVCSAELGARQRAVRRCRRSMI